MNRARRMKKKRKISKKPKAAGGSRSGQVKRITRAEWAAAALELLATRGPAALTVDALAGDLGTSRSSYYWHFKDREEFIRSVLDFWAHEYTEVVLNNPDLQQGSVEKRLLRLLEVVVAYDLAKYEFPVISWVGTVPKFRKIVDQTIMMRRRFIESIIAETGIKGDDCEMRARLFLGYGSYSVPAGLLPKKQRRLAIHRRLVRQILKK